MNDLERNKRFCAIKDIGCLVARRQGHGFVPCDVHHLNFGGKHGGRRRGDEFTIGLNPYTHRGVPFNGWSLDQCRKLFGPSYAREPRRFREVFGSDDELLAEQNQLIRGAYLA